MIEKTAVKIVDFISDYVPMDEDLTEIYKYGVEISISSALNILITMIISLILGDPLSGVVFQICFCSIRSYCGGYHADSYFKCNCTMVILFAITYSVSKVLVYFDIAEFHIMSYVLLLSFIPVYAFSPVKNKYKPLSEKKAKKCRIISFIMYIIMGLIGLVLVSFKSIYGSILIITLVEVAVLIIIEIYRQGRKNNEGQGENS